MVDYSQYHAGDVIYVMYRHPLAPSVAHAQEAKVVEDPDHPGELCLFIYNTYYPFSDEIAVFHTEEEMGLAYQNYLTQSNQGNYYG